MKKNKMDKEWMIKHFTNSMIHYHAMYETLANIAKCSDVENAMLRDECLRLALKYGQLEIDANSAIVNIERAVV